MEAISCKNDKVGDGHKNVQKVLKNEIIYADDDQHHIFVRILNFDLVDVCPENRL